MVSIYIKNNAKELSKEFSNISKEHKKVSKEILRDTANYMYNEALKMVPVYTGETKAGIKIIPRNNSYSVISKVSGRNKGFLQNLFTNETSPFRTLRFRKPNKVQVFYGSPQNVVYGNPNVYNKDGGKVNWSGKPRWFHYASLRAEKYMKDRLRKEAKIA